MGIKLSRKGGTVCAAVAAVALAAGAALPAHASTTGWRQVFNGHYGVANNYSVYGAVAATSSSNAWAFGGSDASDGDGTTQQIEAVHWNGSAWSTLTMPDVPDYIDAASAPAATDIWAVTSHDGYILHYGSTQKWEVVHQLPGAASLELTDVTAINGSDVWVFGGPGSGPGYGTWHFDGTTWSEQSGNAAGISFASALSTTNIWAIGSDGDSPQDAIVHYTRVGWGEKISNSALSGLTFRAIDALSADSVWITATSQDTGFESYLLHYNGHGFSKVAIPGSVDAKQLASDGQGGVWITATTSTNQAYMLHVTANGVWSSTAVSANLDSLASIPGTTSLWASGSKGTSGVAWAYGNV